MQRNYVTIRPLNREDSEDPLDREIDLGASPQPRAPHTLDLDVEPPSRRWPIVAMFLVFAVLTALSVGLFLRSPGPAPAPEKEQKEPAVDSTVVDLPDKPASASAPPAPAELRRDKPVAPNAPSAPVAPIAPVTSGRLLIRSSPADADVFVDGTPRGKTPLALRDLPLGSYTIRVARTGYAAEERTVRLSEQQPAMSTTIDLKPVSAQRSAASTSARSATADKVGRLEVQSRPAGARVYVNDRLAGSTPISIASPPVGPATVRLEKDGYRQWSTKVHINAGERNRVSASLERP